MLDVPASATTEWITAISGAFAALGTVGAVVFALWQVHRQETSRLTVSCGRALAPIGPGHAVHELIRLEAHHGGGAPLKLEMAFFENVRGEMVFVTFLQILTPQLPVFLSRGETATVAWEAALVARAEAENGPFRAAFFRDAAGHNHYTPFPGVRVRRIGLRRREIYEVSAAGR